ncbi:hypothetical protein [Laribacter hongkongensis]|uniref:hypothetical protein n=1 Tax=Laribacter hongkongensis TaxID=168471 RepID=UPI001EFD0736|nr:hypothetical protein [Laribacter hongkongensis]MCG9081338.1 hypothetical protein [Laribacter hongkongensis]
MRHLLLLCNRPAPDANAATISEHLDSFGQMPGWKVWELSMLGNIPRGIDLSRFDAVGIHYTLHLSDPNHHFLSPAAIQRLAEFHGLKCIWLHDEYRRVQQVLRILETAGVHIIFSLANGETLKVLYPADVLPSTRLETVLAGYLSQMWLQQSPPPIAQRPIEVGYRARRPPYWLGALGQEKINIGIGFATCPETAVLLQDISLEEQHRLYGDCWIKFLANCRTVLCVESGASVIDFTGEIEQQVEVACDADKSLTFEEASRRFLQGVDGRYMINPISPRVLEAAAMRCVMVAFPGHYSGLMRPWVHYIPLAKDFSNIDEVVAAIRDTALLERIAEQAWKDLACSPTNSYKAFAQHCAAVMDEEYAARPALQPVVCSYTATQFAWILRCSPSHMYRKHVAQTLQRVLFSSGVRGWMFRLWYVLPTSVRQLIRPALKLIGR